MTDQNDRHARDLGQVHQFGAAAPKLRDRAGRCFEVRLIDHLNRIDNHHRRLGLAGLLHDPRETRVGKNEQITQRVKISVAANEAFRTEPRLVRRFLARGIQHTTMVTRQASSHLQQER